MDIVPGKVNRVTSQAIRGLLDGPGPGRGKYPVPVSIDDGAKGSPDHESVVPIELRSKSLSRGDPVN